MPVVPPALAYPSTTSPLNLKALAAKDNNVPFYVALPSSTIDWELKNGKDIPIEQRSGEEVKYVQGSYQGDIVKVLITPEESNVVNYAFDVTPRNLVTGIITERGICNSHKILDLYPAMFIICLNIIINLKNMWIQNFQMKKIL